jgi:polygalacturonase
VALTGDSGSKIDGQGTKGILPGGTNRFADQTALRGMGNDTVAHHKRVFGPVFVQFLGCKNVLIKGITLVDSPFWILHPVFSTNVIVKDVTVDSPYVNNDGIDPDGNSS